MAVSLRISGTMKGDKGLNKVHTMQQGESTVQQR